VYGILPWTAALDGWLALGVVVGCLGVVASAAPTTSARTLTPTATSSIVRLIVVFLSPFLTPKVLVSQWALA
jgi:hypothetical protein